MDFIFLIRSSRCEEVIYIGFTARDRKILIECGRGPGSQVEPGKVFFLNNWLPPLRNIFWFSHPDLVVCVCVSPTAYGFPRAVFPDCSPPPRGLFKMQIQNPDTWSESLGRRGGVLNSKCDSPHKRFTYTEQEEFGNSKDRDLILFTFKSPVPGT